MQMNEKQVQRDIEESEKREEDIKSIKQIVSDINITVCENRDRINMIEQRLDLLIALSEKVKKNDN